MGKQLFFAGLFWLPSVFGLSKNLSVDGIELEIENGVIGSVADVIEWLPDEIFTNAVLVYESLSLQEARPDRPRVVLFNDTGTFIVAFTSDPALAGGQTVEVIEFDEETRKFHFSQIDWASETPKVERNPEFCKHCHTTDLRPNWDTYPLWTGVYGSSRPALHGNERGLWQGFYQEKSQWSRLNRIVFRDMGVDPLEAQHQTNIRFIFALSKLNSMRIRRIVEDRSGDGFTMLASALRHPKRALARAPSGWLSKQETLLKTARQNALTRHNHMTGDHLEAEHVLNFDVRDLKRTAAFAWTVQELGLNPRDLSLSTPIHLPQDIGQFANGQEGVIDLIK